MPSLLAGGRCSHLFININEIYRIFIEQNSCWIMVVIKYDSQHSSVDALNRIGLIALEKTHTVM